MFFTVRLRCLSDSSEKLSPAKQHQPTRLTALNLRHRHASPKVFFFKISVEAVKHPNWRTTCSRLVPANSSSKDQSLTWQHPLQTCCPNSGFLKYSGSWRLAKKKKKRLGRLAKRMGTTRKGSVCRAWSWSAFTSTGSCCPAVHPLLFHAASCQRAAPAFSRDWSDKCSLCQLMHLLEDFGGR